MKTVKFLLYIFVTFSITSAESVYNFPAHECIRINNTDQFDPDSMSIPSKQISCRPGQKAINATIKYGDVSLKMSCCDWLTNPPEQIKVFERVFIAFNCKFKSGSNIPKRSSMIVKGDDLACFKGEELKDFEIDWNEYKVTGSCCFDISKTTTTMAPIMTTLAPSDVTTCTTQQTFLKTIGATTSEPKKTFKLQASANSLPSIIVASECIYASPTATEPIKGYMSYDDPNYQIACRSSLQQELVTLETVNDGITYNIYCCKTNPKMKKPSTIEKILAHECEYEHDDGVNLLSYSGVTPGDDLVCDTETHELMVTKAKHVVTNKTVTIACCQPHEFTTTTEEPEETTTTTTKKTTTSLKPTTLSTTTALVSTLKPSTTTLKSPATTTVLTTSQRTTPFTKYGQPKGDAGPECVYLGDGTLKVNYMAYCDDNPICRSQQYMKRAKDKAKYDRCCCQFSQSMKPDYSIQNLIAPTCEFREDTSFMRWTIIKSGRDLICKENHRIVNTVIRENDKDVQMSCCLRNDLNVPTTTTSTTTTTTTVSPGTTKAGATTTKKFSTTTTSQALLPPMAGIQCSYNDDQTLKNSFMDDCTPNMVCRSKEKLISTYITLSDNSKVKKCCCDYRADLPATNNNGPTIIAPKCYYNDAGYINTWSVISAGDDLGCLMSDNLMTFNMANGKVADQQMSCCLKKDATTIPTTARTTPKSTTTVRTTTIAPPKTSALECFYVNTGKLNYNYMDWWTKELVCRSNYKMKIENVTTSQGNLEPKCCCELEKTLPQPTAVRTILAATCYFKEGTGTLSRWSLMKFGVDLACESDSYLYNTTIFYNGADNVYSCCQPKDQDIPTTAAPPTGDLSTPDPTSEILYFALPICEYRSDKTLRTSFMEYCSFDLVCRSQELMVNTTVINRYGEKTTKCCCDPHPELPPEIPPYQIRAQKCVFNQYGYVAQWSVVPFGIDLICAEHENLITYLLEFDSQERNMSCCLEKTSTTLETTSRSRSTSTQTESTTPLTTLTSTISTTTSLETTSTTSQVITTSTLLPNTTTSQEPTTTTTENITTPTTTIEDTTLPVNTTHAHLNLGDPTTTVTPKFGNITTPTTTIKTTTTFKTTTIANKTETTKKPDETTTSKVTEITTTATKAGTEGTITTAAETTKTPFKGKRTAPPKSMPPPRTVKDGECPDCIYPQNGMINGIDFITAHLARAGPSIGRCPMGYTMKIVYPMPALGYKDSKCCCVNNQFPLPYALN
ncbi:hypothetical protein PVAND_017855 [Polypedilum vanderplanki]|uniref:Uncharacterized protein n=1 Tax=Polypedilum vanderplanki TaxID=319348 RepID=A0A9J6B9N1_POLVA|nr:hypothetical protein PVAND_017855 [Polypedilum vanderplanki]